MKIYEGRKPEGFFEVFSDLIFATMAIFILLFVIILTQINPPSKTKAVDLVVAIDTSGSMAEPIEELIQTLQELSRNFPRIIRDFRVGVVAYSEKYEGGYDVFELSRMTEAEVERLEVWLDALSADNSAVDVIHALQRSVDMFGARSEADIRRSLVLIGDVGPYEVIDRQVNRNPAGQIFISVDRDAERELFGIVEQFIAGDPGNRFLAVFTGEDGRTGAYEPSKALFCALSEAGGARAQYADSANSLIWELLGSFLRDEPPAADDEALPEACA